MSQQRNVNLGQLFFSVAILTGVILIVVSLQLIARFSENDTSLSLKKQSNVIQSARYASPPPRRICSNKTYTSSRRVYEDNDCYPPYMTIPSSEAYIPPSVLKHSKVDQIISQNWKIGFEETRPEDEMRKESVVIKSFSNVHLYRNSYRTFILGSNVWTAVERCDNVGKSTAEPPTELVMPPYKGERIEKAILAVSDNYGPAFYHLIVEKVFILGAFRSILESDPDMKIIVDFNTGLLLVYLSLIRVIPQRIIYLPEHGGHVMVDQVLVPYYAECCFTNPVFLQTTRKWMRDLQPEFYRTQPKKNGDIVVLDRRSETGECKRCLANQAELVAALKLAFPTRKVYAHKMGGVLDVLNNMKVLSGTELIVAPHGAGLMNIIFLPSHGKVLEIMSHPDWMSHCFHDLAVNFGLLYRGIAPYHFGPQTLDWDNADILKVVDVAKEMMKHEIETIEN